jgi:2-polyprenyl-3-methyl-5-hydroxy-6-metoxy-1,4-benzoquinol methylase
MTNNKKEISKKNIKIFFKDRANTHDEKQFLKTVIYQDKNPKLAKKRDLFEKKKIKDILNVSKNDVILDIGCGIGRWADGMSEKVKKYVGIDYLDEFINIANIKYKKKNNIYFINLESTKLSNSKVKSHSPYTIIMIMGLYPYINDKEGCNILKKLLEVSANECKIIIREPIAVKKEIILNNVWSDDMETYYSAKYRTHDWFKKNFNEILFKKGYNLIIDEPLYPKHLNNRIETKQHLFYLKK